MSHLSRDDLYSLEEYSQIRPEFRAKVMEHKKNRRVQIGENAALYFEDALTMKYQIQEMLRIEKIFESEGINEELDAYNPLIPDGDNWKATFMMEYPDVEERKVALAQLIGIENKTWVQVDGFDKVYAIADEDLERDTEEKTSSVHFLRFQLSDADVDALRSGASLSMGIDHDAYRYAVTPLPDDTRAALLADLD